MKIKYIILILAFIVAVTAIVSAYYCSSHDQIIATRFKTYDNAQDAFKFRYPYYFLVEDHSDGQKVVLNLKNDDGSYPIYIYAVKQNDPSIKETIKPVVKQNQELKNKTAIILGNLIWNGFEVDDLPQNGVGTVGSETTYYTTANNGNTYILKCINCSEEIFGDSALPSESSFISVLQSFMVN